MGLNKHFVTKETIEFQIINKKPIKELFDINALIFMDDISKKVYQMICDNISEIEIINFFNQNK